MRKLLIALPFLAAQFFFACAREPVAKPSSQGDEAVGEVASRHTTEQKTAESGLVEQRAIAHTAEQASPSYAAHWRYFSHGSDGTSIVLRSSDTVSDIPAVDFKPWTEAVRVSDMCIHNREAVFLINKCGAYNLDYLHTSLPSFDKKNAYSDLTAGNLYTVGGRLFIRVYQNTTFLSQGTENAHFLVHAVLNSGTGNSFADVTHLHFPNDAQCKSLMQAQGQWYASFKTDNGKEVRFFYVMCNSFEGFMRKDAYKQVKGISAQAFREACEPPSYTKLPEMLKVPADKVKKDSALYLKMCSHDVAHSTLFLLQSVGQGSHRMTEHNIPHSAYALQYTSDSGKQYAAILLPTGTLLLNREGRALQKIELPTLPENFRYTAFFLSDTSITAAWEESAFYRVGRAGLFTAHLTELGL